MFERGKRRSFGIKLGETQYGYCQCGVAQFLLADSSPHRNNSFRRMVVAADEIEGWYDMLLCVVQPLAEAVERVARSIRSMTVAQRR